MDFVHIERTAGNLPRTLLAESIACDTDVTTTLAGLKKSLQLANYKLLALLSTGQYQFILTDVIEGSPDEVREILRWKLKDQVDFPVDQAAIDFLPVPALGRPPPSDCYHFSRSCRRTVSAIFSVGKISVDCDRCTRTRTT